MKLSRPLVVQKQRRAGLGFTLIEMLVVLVLVGIFGFFAAPNLLSNPKTTLDSQARAFASDLRRVQLLATVRSVSLCVLAGGSSYSVVYACDQPSTQMVDPATGHPFVREFTHGVAFTNAPIVPPLTFNSLGQPNGAASYTIGPASGTTSFLIHVAPLTGFVATSVATP